MLNKLAKYDNRAWFFFIDCFEEVPYDGVAIKFTDPLSKAKDRTFSNQRTAKSCQLLCQKEEKCNYFTWTGRTQITTTNNANNFRCYLKTEKDGNGEAGGGTNFMYKDKAALIQDKIVSGPKYCIIRKDNKNIQANNIL